MLDDSENMNSIVSKKEVKPYFQEYIENLKNSFRRIIYKVKKWPLKNPIKLIVIIVMLLVFFILIKNTPHDLIKKSIRDVIALLDSILFTKGNDNKKDFEWIGVTTFLAIVTFIFNTIYSKKKFKADLVSNSRIGWIQKTRIYVLELHF